MLLTAGACQRNTPPSPSATSPAPSAIATTAGMPTEPPTEPPAASPAAWPTGPRTLPAVTASGEPVLVEIRTGRHEGYERIVLQFAGAFGQVRVAYVPEVHADPSDQVIVLPGRAFLEITVHDAYARWGQAAGKTNLYTGPDTVTPGYPVVRQIRISGDFENVLSLGVGLDHAAGFQISRLRSPDRLVIDVSSP
jgi:hypothetical protein